MTNVSYNIVPRYIILTWIIVLSMCSSYVRSEAGYRAAQGPRGDAFEQRYVQHRTCDVLLILFLLFCVFLFHVLIVR